MITLIVLLTLAIIGCAIIVTIGAPLLFIVVDILICLGILGIFRKIRNRKNKE